MALLALSTHAFADCLKAELALESYRNSLIKMFDEQNVREIFFALRQIESGKSVRSCKGATAYFGKGHCSDLSSQLDGVFQKMKITPTANEKISDASSNDFLSALSLCPKNERVFYLTRFTDVSEKYAEMHSLLQSTFPRIWDPATQEGFALLRLASPKAKPARFIELLPKAISELDAYIVKMRLLGSAFQLKTLPAQERIVSDAKHSDASQSEVR